MPAKSKQQQKFFGVVKAMQKGDIPKKGEAGDVADDMTKKEVDKMASTKHKGLPKKVKEIIRQELVKEISRRYQLTEKELDYQAPPDTDKDDIEVDPDTTFKVDLKHLLQKHKIKESAFVKLFNEAKMTPAKV